MIPDYFEAVTAYRCWDVMPNGLLCGQAVREPWPMYQAMVSRCAAVGSDGRSHVDAKGHWIDAPVMNCDCGVHGYKTYQGAEGRILRDPNAGYNDFGRPQGRAWGELKLWGKLIEHEDGYRAQFAYPSSLWCEDEKLAAKIAALYGVPCQVKALERPKGWLEYDGTGISIRYLTSSWISAAPVSPSYYYLSPMTAVTPSPSSTPNVVQPATIAQIKALGSTKYQRKQAALSEANKIAAAARKKTLIQQYLGKGATALDVQVEA